MKKIDIISFHPGRQHNLEQAFHIHKTFKSFKHLTGLFFQRSTVDFWDKISKKISSNLRKRSIDLPKGSVDTNPFFEFFILLKIKLGYQIKYSIYQKRNNAFQNWVVKNYTPPKICIGYDTACSIIFERWKGKSFLILDLSIAIPQYKLILAKQNKFDDKFIANQTKGDDALYEVYEKELDLADLILCGSEFVKQSCLAFGIRESKLKVIPYGADLTRFRKDTNESLPTDKIKIVFVGTVNYRKGADTVFEAWEEVSKHHNNVELHFYGNVQIDLPQDKKGMFFHGFIDQNNLIEELKTAHISVLPSFIEGSSLAIYQSMAMELAVITTPNTGSIVEHMKNGLLISYGSVNELVWSLQLLINDHKLRLQLSKQAKEDIQDYTWDNYGNKLNALLQEVLAQNNSVKGYSIKNDILSI